MTSPSLARRATSAFLALTLALIVVATDQTAPQAAAAPPEPFNPGNIISDEVFFDGTSMTSGEIQTFLNSKVSSCQSGYVCLKDFRQTTPTIPSDSYCSGYAGASNESAATIIAKVGASCNVSPKALIVTLQKEQGLVTHTWPSSWRFDKAMGYACSDSAPCDSAYGGFVYQMYYAARQFQRYAASPTRYNYQTGRVNNILFHPNTACGTSPVYIENQATAGLYNYTPYQPNSAALANLYGSGDVCSSYGNRNFWRYYWDWFGNPIVSSPLLKASGDNKIYLIGSDGKKYHVTSWELYLELARLGSYAEVSPTYLSSVPDGGVATRLLTNGSPIAVLSRGSLYWLPSCADMINFGYATCGGTGVTPLTTAQYALFPRGSNLTNTVNGVDGAIFSITAGVLTEYPSSAARTAAGFTAPAPTLSNSALAGLTIGVPTLTTPVLATDRSTGKTRLVVAGTAYTVPSTILPPTVARVALRSASLAALTQGPDLQELVKGPDESVLWLTPAGSYVVPPALLEDASTIPAVPSELISLWPALGTISAGTMVKATDAPKVYLLTEDGRRHITSWSLAVRLSGGNQPTWATVSPALVNAIHDVGPFLASGTLVRAAGHPEVYYVASDKSMVWVRTLTLTDAAGIRGITIVSDDQYAAYTILPDSFSYGFVCSDSSYIAGRGAVHPIPDALKPDYAGLPLVPIDDSACAMLTVGAPATKYIGAPDGKIYLVESGGKRWIPSWGRWLEISGGSTWTRVTQELVDALPTGDPV